MAKPDQPKFNNEKTVFVETNPINEDSMQRSESMKCKEQLAYSNFLFQD